MTNTIDTPQPAIAIADLSVCYGRKTVLQGLSATIESGACYAVMGPNGCGKTTLLRCIGGLMEPAGGSVELCGRPVHSYPARELARRVAYVQQHPLRDIEFTAYETVMTGRNPYQRNLHGESEADRQAVEQAMLQTNTWHLRNTRTDRTSGGELQRIALARAIAQQTPVMLLDEPVSNLDIAHQFDILSLLAGIEGKTVLIVIHDLNLALRYCPRLLLLSGGGVVYQGSTADGLTPENIKHVFGVEAEVDNGWVRILGRSKKQPATQTADNQPLK
ncbi:MAG: ABC transporter ATP-binding protein [Bacteroidales bacterium]|nr:ABC transporter ATP-binding protein [Bacteroidales bacterium]